MTATVEHYDEVVSAFPDSESLTVLTVAGAGREQVAAGLGVDLSRPVEAGWGDDEDVTGWALFEVPGGVVAAELTGYGDPSVADLVALSERGSSAVVRGNIQAHYRFGCARARELVFDDDEYVYLDDPATFPAELRPLFDLVWNDLESEDLDDEGPDALAVGLAMAEVVTGVEVTPAHVGALLDSGFFAARTQRYVE